jgi:hypothetical protein
MGSSRRGFLAMLGVIPGWFLGKAFCKEELLSVSTAIESTRDCTGLKDWLRKEGYHEEDAEEITESYRIWGLGAAIHIVENWDDEKHVYSAELCDVIHKWRFGNVTA